VPAQRSSRGAQRSGRLSGLLVVVLLLVLAVWSVAALQPPDAAPADAPATDFSAGRAFAQVQQIAAETHVAGSAANDRVVDGLVRTLAGLGLDARVQNSVGARSYGPGEARMARVRNVVAVLPGTDPTGRLFLTAHHDSVETGPGAADDAAGVAAVLEAVRALTAGTPLRNDVVVVLTDAEEACLCGAEAFVGLHALGNGGGVVLNVEARGTGGPPIMFETSRGNAGLAVAYAAAAPHPVASSFAVEVYRVMPNFTDFSVFVEDGDFTGLNTAFIDGAAGYHTPQDVPERLDRGTLQALGGNALGVVRELGNRDLAPLAEEGADDTTYFPVLGELIQYPDRWVRPLALAGLVMVGLLALVARRRRLSSLPRTAAGAALAAVPLVAAPLAAQGLWWLLVAIRPEYGQMLDPWRPGWYRLATIAVLAAVVLTWYAALRRRMGAVPLALGGLVWLAVLGAVLAAVAPGGSYLATLPALAGALTGLVAVLTPWRWLQLAAVLIGGGVAVVVLAPTVALFLPALGLSVAAAPAAVATLLLVALLPAAELLFPEGPAPWPSTALVPGVAGVVAVACGLVGLSVDRFDADHPVPTRLAYVLDTERDQAWWVSTESDPGTWTAPYVPGGDPLPDDYPYLTDDMVTGPASTADLRPPSVEVLNERDAGNSREFALTVTPQRADVRFVTVEVTADEGTVVRARAAGGAVPEESLGEDRLLLTFHASPADGLRLEFAVQGGGPVTVRALDASHGLSGLPGFTPRPSGVDAAGSHSADLVLVSTATTLD
jgi:hypothetical protein